MSEQRENKGSGKKPDFIAYHVKESQDGKGYWNKVGAAWRHRDGQGLDINLESVPVDGRLTLREMREERMQAYEDQRQSQNDSQQHEQARQPERSRDRSR